MSFLSVFRARRAELTKHFDIVRQFEKLEESCVPSYVHSNVGAAFIAWKRLFLTAKLYHRHAPKGPVLDFGAATGELYHALTDNGASVDYSFVEQDDIVAKAALTFIPGATRLTLENLPDEHYACIFALDSLEHNDDVEALLDILKGKLKSDGVFILSGPTENWLYRLGRRLAGFSGHYHKTTIKDIEALATKGFNLVEMRRLPIFPVALFNISAWTRKP